MNELLISILYFSLLAFIAYYVPLFLFNQVNRLFEIDPASKLQRVIMWIGWILSFFIGLAGCFLHEKLFW